jgi:ABC-type ATPase involved in cell division
MLADVKKSYDNEVVLQNFTMTVSKGEFAFITGPSGAGKSTQLDCQSVKNKDRALFQTQHRSRVSGLQALVQQDCL